MNNRGIEINEDGSYSLTKVRKTKRAYPQVNGDQVIAKDRHSARCKFVALNCADLND